LTYVGAAADLGTRFGGRVDQNLLHGRMIEAEETGLLRRGREEVARGDLGPSEEDPPVLEHVAVRGEGLEKAQSPKAFHDPPRSARLAADAILEMGLALDYQHALASADPASPPPTVMMS